MTLDKLKYGAINNKKILLFLFGLSIISIITGSLFLTIISKNDQNIVVNYMNNYITNIKELSNIQIFDNILSNIGFILLIWLLGISIIGIPIIIFMYFSKIFTLGFAISSFIITYKTKGLIFAIIYIFPVQIINVLIYTLITLYAIKISNNLIYSIFNKENVNFKKIMNKYIYILIICLIATAINTMLDNFLIPFLFNKIIYLMKI